MQTLRPVRTCAWRFLLPAACHADFFRRMPRKEECVYIVAGINHAVLTDGNRFSSKAHGGEAIILRNNNISRLHHIHERKIHAVISFGNSDRFCSGSLENVRGIAQDYAVYFSLA